jgi:hypothetical protein
MPKQSVVDKQLKKWAKDAGITKTISFHKSRHYAESRTMPSEDADFSRSTYFPLVNSA